MGYKSSIFPLNSQIIPHISAIYHISVLFIPEIWRDKRHIVILQCDFAINNLKEI